MNPKIADMIGKAAAGGAAAGEGVFIKKCGPKISKAVLEAVRKIKAKR